jgi:hypothetical protein
LAWLAPHTSLVKAVTVVGSSPSLYWIWYTGLPAAQQGQEGVQGGFSDRHKLAAMQ